MDIQIKIDFDFFDALAYNVIEHLFRKELQMNELIALIIENPGACPALLSALTELEMEFIIKAIPHRHG